MRRRTLVAALLATTAICRPDPAYAMPQVAAFVAGAIAGATPIYLGGATVAGFGAGVAFGSSVLGGLVVNTVLSLGLSAIADSLRPQPRLTSPSDRMANFAQPVSYVEWVFGRARKGGPLGFTGFANKRRYYVPILAAHPIEGIVEHWLDEWTVGVDGDSTDFSSPNLLTEGDGQYSAPDVAAPYGRIEPFLGQSGQTANSGLVGVFDEVTTDFDFASLAGGVIWARRPPGDKFSRVYPRSRQWAWAPVIDGHNRIYDPRDNTYKYTANAALVLAYWLTEILGQQVDWDEVATEADVSDEVVVTAEGDSIARWEINGVIADDQDFEQQRAQMAGACDAFLYERTDGLVGFKVGRWIEPSVTLTDDDFLALEVVEGQGGAENPTEVAATYIEPENNWRETPSGVWVADDTGRRRRDNPQLYLVRYHNQAARLIKRIAAVKRAQYQVRGTLGMAGYELIGERFVTLRHAGLGIDIPIEVGKLRRTGPATFELEAVSTAPSHFAFDAATEEPERPAYNGVESDDSVDDVAGVAARSVGGGAIEVDWSEADESLSQQVRVTDSEGSSQVYTVPDDQRPFRITGLADGETYEVSVRNRTAAYRAGAWSSSVEVTVVSESSPPEALQDFGVALVDQQIEVSATGSNDPRYAGTQFWRATTTDFGDAEPIRTIYAAPSSELRFTDMGDRLETIAGEPLETIAGEPLFALLPPATYRYWAAPINRSGVEGPRVGPASETIT